MRPASRTKKIKTLPLTQNSFQILHEMLTASIRSRLLLAGIELGVFDEMEYFRPTSEISGAIGSHAGNTERFLDALATIGLVEKNKGLYRNRPEASEFLVKHAPAYLGALLQITRRMCVDSLKDLSGRIKQGPLPETNNRDFASALLWSQATRACALWVTGGAGAQMAEIVSSLPEFSGFRRMLDLGGGQGMFALHFIDAHPSMSGVVFDRPVVADVANHFIRKYGMQDRVSVLAGDCLTDDIGRGYDFIWACATLHFVRRDLDPVIMKVFDALNPGGVFISFQEGMAHLRTRPDPMPGHLGNAIQMDLDFSFDRGEIVDSMLRCGFRSVRSRTIDTPMGVMDLDIARKPNRN